MDETLATEATVPRLDDFKQQFESYFAENMLNGLDWGNMVVAGGSVVGCTRPIPSRHQDMASKRAYYRDTLLGSSDIDIFLYGLTEEEANKKITYVYDHVCGACPFQVVCFRSANAVTMVSQYPYRHIQIVLRLYASPYEVLAGFDVDACTFAYDGTNVWTSPRGHHALVSGYNTIDVTRRSPSYEMRLAKYSKRGFGVAVPVCTKKAI